MHEKRHLPSSVGKAAEKWSENVAEILPQYSRNLGRDNPAGPWRCRLLFNLGNQRPTLLRKGSAAAAAAIRHVIILHHDRREGERESDPCVQVACRYSFEIKGLTLL